MLRNGWKMVLLVGAVMLTACNDGEVPTEPVVPGSIVGIWIVESMDGQQLPASRPEAVQGVSCVITVRAMSITFLSNKQYSRTQTLGVNCQGHAPFDDTSTGFGTYTVVGDRLTIVDRDYPGEPEVSTFVIEEPRLTLSSADTGDGTGTLVARRR